MRGIKVLDGGFLTTVQDRGRFGFQRFGLPAAGAVDEFSHRVGNLLVGNPENAASLEITLTGPHLEFSGGVLVAVTGANLQPLVDGKAQPLWESFWIKEGSVLSFNTIREGCRAYLSLGGGFCLPPAMGSLSTYLKGHIGGFQGRRLQKGDFVPLNQLPPGTEALTGQHYRRELVPFYPTSQTVRAVLGPQDDFFTPKAQNIFFSSDYTIAMESDRMGCRLQGVPLEHAGGADIISDGIPAGAIQVPGDGQPIIMLADRPTTGGYPKIATVITSDLPKVAQLKPGEKIRFTAVSIEEAERALHEFEKSIYFIE